MRRGVADPKIRTGMIATDRSEEINHAQEKKSCPGVQGESGACPRLWCRPELVRSRNSRKAKPRKAFKALRGFMRSKFGGSCGDRTCDSLLKRLSAILYMDFHLFIYSFKNS